MTQTRAARIRSYAATRNNPIVRWLYRAPLFLWRLGLGPWLMPTFVLLTTRGRTTGLPRRVLLDCRTLDGTRYVYSGYGDRADWFRNALADPRVVVQSRYGTQLMRARRVTASEEIVRVAPRHADRFAILALEPLAEPTSTPPPFRADLWWLCPTLGLAGLATWWRRVHRPS